MKNIEKMTLEELWRLFPIILTPPDNRWVEWAEKEISYLKEILGNMIAAIHHVGSTAIKGIWAKPIIDLIIETEDLSNFSIIKSKIIKAGYICMNETECRLDFNKGYTPEGFATKVYHLHVRICGDNDEVYFRDYLNSHADIAKEYETLKLSLWKPFEHNRDGYTNAKASFVKRYTQLGKSEVKNKAHP